MTVSDLIAKLSTYPADARVILLDPAFLRPCHSNDWQYSPMDYRQGPTRTLICHGRLKLVATTT
jgi:hypothetical protein